MTTSPPTTSPPPITSVVLLERLRRLHPQLIDLSLGRIEALLARLGDPHTRLPPVIHVAGTNGKGSVCAYLKAMLEAAGLRVAVFTSPHLVRFHERIALPPLIASGADGRAVPIGEAYLIDILARTEAANAGAPMTFFEITTAAAFLAFAETPADALILEVGLGGRLDATNVVARPALTVITSISLDHMHFLGDTIEKIAAEKAGIMKRGTPCVVAPQEDAVGDVLHGIARRVGAPLLAAGEQFTISVQNGRLIVEGEEQLADMPLPALLGPHQIDNAGTAVVAAQQLGAIAARSPRTAATRRLAIPDEAIARGLQEVRWPARMQRLTTGVLPALLEPGCELWLDGGHNADAARVIASTLADLEERSPRALILITALLKNKDAAGFLAHFRGLARAVLCVPIAGDDGAMDPGGLAAIARGLGLTARTSAGIASAIAEAQLDADWRPLGEPVRVLICGSLHLAGHVLAVNEGAAQQRN